MKLSPTVQQIIVIVSPQLVLISSGAAVAFSSVFLAQLASSNEVMKYEDPYILSWVGSIRSLAGLLGILQPSLMQWKGRKFAFISGSLAFLIGWIITYIASNVTMVLISECFHGFGSTCLASDCMMGLSEMVNPKYRNVAMTSLIMMESMGLVFMGIVGKYIHWKIVSLIMCLPIMIAICLALLWPESPSWLAYKGNFEKCERVFIGLRGSGETSKKELEELIAAQRERLNADKTKEGKTLSNLWVTVTRKDFYKPCFHLFILLCMTYWGGSIQTFIFPIQMLEKVTDNVEITSYGSIIVNGSVFVGICVNSVLISRFDNKIVLLTSCICVTVCLLSTSLTDYLQTQGVIDKDSLVSMYILFIYIIIMAGGALPLVFTLTAELIPVKHKGLGGAMFVIFTCVLLTSSLQASPHMISSLGLWGTLLINVAINIVCGTIVWRTMPETKRRTLQEIEDYYNYGHFNVTRTNKEVEKFEFHD